MHRSRLWQTCCFLVVVSALSLQPASSQEAKLIKPAPRDEQAVALLRQALTVGGGEQAIRALTDYVASGQVNPLPEQGRDDSRHGDDQRARGGTIPDGYGSRAWPPFRCD